MFQEGRHLAETEGVHSMRANPAWDSERIAFRRIRGEGHDSLLSHHFLRAARCQISEDLDSAAQASAVPIMEIQDLATQDSAIQVSAVRSSDRICRSFRTCSSVVCFMWDRHSLGDRRSWERTCWLSLQARLFPRWSQMETIRADSLGLTWDLVPADMTWVQRSAQRPLGRPVDSV
jgi:hypothetical protein